MAGLTVVPIASVVLVAGAWGWLEGDWRWERGQAGLSDADGEMFLARSWKGLIWDEIADGDVRTESGEQD